MKIKNEKIFNRFTRYPSEPTKEGKKQFFEQQSHGVSPKQKEPYYISLNDGKEQFDLLCREYQQMYQKREWWGFYQLWIDWKGERWLLPHLCKWHRMLPKWLGKEKIDIDKMESS